MKSQMEDGMKKVKKAGKEKHEKLREAAAGRKKGVRTYVVVKKKKLNQKK